MRYAPGESNLGRTFIVLCPDVNQHVMFEQLLNTGMFRIERVRVAYVKLASSLKIRIETLVSCILNGLY